MSITESFLIIATTSPYGSHQPRAALDMALTAAAFEQDVSIVFMDAAVLQLLKGQSTASGTLKNVGKMIPALTLYEVKSVYVHQPSATHYDLSDLDYVEDMEAIDDSRLKTLVEMSDHVMVF